MVYKIDVNRKAVQKKMEQVKQAAADMKKYKTVALLDLRKLPDALFQNLRKKIRQDGGKVYVLKKPVVSRVLATNKKLASKLDACNNPVALIYTDKSAYEVNSFFKQNRKSRAAKIGDVSSVDIIVPAGDTDLPPGPALSELKTAGLNVQIKAGKIAVIKDSTVAKAGEKITVQKVKALQTLGVKPFEIMASMLFGFDGEYIYSKEILDIGDSISSDMASSFSQAMNLSLNVSYPTGQNISVLLTDALRQSMNLSLNGDLYSSSTMEQLLSSAMRQGSALSKLG